jgi:hypothetical protein
VLLCWQITDFAWAIEFGEVCQDPSWGVLLVPSGFCCQENLVPSFWGSGLRQPNSLQERLPEFGSLCETPSKGTTIGSLIVNQQNDGRRKITFPQAGEKECGEDSGRATMQRGVVKGFWNVDCSAKKNTDFPSNSDSRI